MSAQVIGSVMWDIPIFCLSSSISFSYFILCLKKHLRENTKRSWNVSWMVPTNYQYLVSTDIKDGRHGGINSSGWNIFQRSTSYEQHNQWKSNIVGIILSCYFQCAVNLVLVSELRFPVPHVFVLYIEPDREMWLRFICI